MCITSFASSRPLARDELLEAPIRYPRPARLSAPLSVGGPKATEAASSLGLLTVGDLLEHLPGDRREARSIAQLASGESATVVVEVRAIASRPVRRRGMRPLVEATVADGSGAVKATFFNQPWLVQKYPAGTRIVLHGKLEGRGFRVQGHAPTTEAAASLDGVAHYRATEGISSTQIHALVREHASALGDVVEPLPGLMLAAEALPDRSAALAAVHFPERESDQPGGRSRLAFDELLLVQLALLRRRARRAENLAAPVLADPRELTGRWLEHLLPFKLTSDQKAAIAAIDRDLEQPRPMQRLLMGEVGSGKTVIALYALLRAIEHGHQGALMAPTETLAEQHFATIQSLLAGEPVSLALLTGSTPAARRADILRKLETGELALLVGTHAVIEETVRFARLAVAVVDEQHRFGVRQRAALDAKGGEDVAPHVLHMTATPIPRTLALARHGDLDFTVLRELPRGRQPITTHMCTTERERARAYERIREELRAGRQAFVVCPLVEESELLQARAATAEFERLAGGELRDFRVALLHGQLRSREKQAAMAAFASGATDVLVATSVIEVGIDVPNATVMLVEDADRYGISQLHQLRGRIGRGAHASLCLLFGPKGSARLRALEAHGDGFKLAEIDLDLRNEGELIGTRQHGLQQFRVAELPRDTALLERARALAERIVGDDASLSDPEHALLADVLERAHGAEVQVPIPA
ncbi:MAG: ATP-dependent DNA helicase RecG [Actinomycetota bacterium]|nr:ATP-dependent DNA helicase RecG [Actinomycetota bacterium]